jgi:hypothetical protein
MGHHQLIALVSQECAQSVAFGLNNALLPERIPFPLNLSNEPLDFKAGFGCFGMGAVAPLVTPNVDFQRIQRSGEGGGHGAPNIVASTTASPIFTMIPNASMPLECFTTRG